MGGYELQKQKQSQKIAKLNKSNDSLKWTCLKKVNIRKKDNNNTCINNNTSVHTPVIMASFWDERKKSEIPSESSMARLKDLQEYLTSTDYL